MQIGVLKWNGMKSRVLPPSLAEALYDMLTLQQRGQGGDVWSDQLHLWIEATLSAPVS